MLPVASDFSRVSTGTGPPAAICGRILKGPSRSVADEVRRVIEPSAPMIPANSVPPT